LDLELHEFPPVRCALVVQNVSCCTQLVNETVPETALLGKILLRCSESGLGGRERAFEFADTELERYGVGRRR